MKSKAGAAVELFYWPGIPGRGEFVRLLLEDAGVKYVDVARSRGSGLQAMQRFLDGREAEGLPFAPPFVRVGGAVIWQTANILSYLSAQLGLPPRGARARAEANQIQLTIADFVDEIHDTHHPVAGSLYYEDQKSVALRRSRIFVAERMPRYLGWLEALLARNAARAPWFVGRQCSHVDLSAFHVVAGLRYAFPRAMAEREPNLPHLVSLHDRVAARPRLAAYLQSKRRQPFNQMGIFRHYPELDSRRRTRRRD